MNTCRKILPSKFNMSEGILPAIVASALSLVVNIYVSLLVGMATGMLLLFVRRGGLPKLLLAGSTLLLFVLFAVFLFFPSLFPATFAFPFLIEMTALFPSLAILAGYRGMLSYLYIRKRDGCCLSRFVQGIEASVVSARVILSIGILHLLLVVCLLPGGLDEMAHVILFSAMPPLVLSVAFVLNRLLISYFNKKMENEAFVPVVDARGHVKGRSALTVASSDCSSRLMYPIVRIALTIEGMLHLHPRPHNSTFDAGRVDVLAEDFLLYGEKVTQGARRILKQVWQQAPLEKLRFNLAYHYQGKQACRLVYLFTLPVDENCLCLPRLEGGKPWPAWQIEANLGRGYFSRLFEHEYSHLSAIIDKEERYTES